MDKAMDNGDKWQEGDVAALIDPVTGKRAIGVIAVLDPPAVSVEFGELWYAASVDDLLEPTPEELEAAMLSGWLPPP